MNVATLLDGLWLLEIKSRSSSVRAWQAHCLTDWTPGTCTQQPGWAAKEIFHHLFLSLCDWPAYWSADRPVLQDVGVWVNVGMTNGRRRQMLVGTKERWIRVVGDLVWEIISANRVWKHSRCVLFYLLHIHKHAGIGFSCPCALCPFYEFFFPVKKRWQRVQLLFSLKSDTVNSPFINKITDVARITAASRGLPSYASAKDHNAYIKNKPLHMETASSHSKPATTCNNLIQWNPYFYY